MGVYRNWVGIVRRKFSKRTIIIVHANNSKCIREEEEEKGSEGIVDFKEADDDSSSLNKIEFSEEDIAAIKIQAFFRGYLARRAFRALKSLVKLQAVVRGVQVRKQSQIALHCMHALVQLQVRVRTRQLLCRAGDY